MEFFRDTKIDFMRYRSVFITLSAILIAVGIVSLFVHGKLNVGIDFAGGTQITVGFQEQPDVEEIRRLLGDAGVDEAQIQRYGPEGSGEVLIKTPTVEGSEEGSRDQVVAALDARYNPGAASNPDLNRIGTEALAEMLLNADPDGIAADGEVAMRDHYGKTAQAVVDLRTADGLIDSYSQVEGAEGVSGAVAQLLEQQTHLGQFAILGVENVGPQIGRELRAKGQWAVALSLLGMLAYIWIRFELRFGVGALVAVVHDVLITLGLFAILGYEFNLTTIAAFLTLVGYSVNDTVVIFDRVRENMRRSRREPLMEIMNTSLNQTLSRTVLTSGTTLLAVACLFFLGGDVIRGFAFVLMVGVIIGTYSSIYVACPFALLWEQLFGSEAKSRRRAA